jgi:hypothetical protein
LWAQNPCVPRPHVDVKTTANPLRNNLHDPSLSNPRPAPNMASDTEMDDGDGSSPQPVGHSLNDPDYESPDE